MPDCNSNGIQKRHLSAAVSVAERMNGIQIRQKTSQFNAESDRVKALEILMLSQTPKKLGHLTFYILWIAKWISTLGYPDRSETPRPSIDILEQVMVNGAIVPNAKSTFRQWLIRSLVCEGGLELLQSRLVADARNVFQNVCSDIAGRIFNRGVGQLSIQSVRTFVSGVAGARKLAGLWFRKPEIPVPILDQVGFARQR